MGIRIYLLDSRKVTLVVDGLSQRIGTLRSFRKITEIDAECNKILGERAKGKRGPVAVMVADFEEFALAASPGHTVAAHRVMSWESSFTRTNDSNWDCLPFLGYAVRSGSSEYTLHEEQNGLLHLVTVSRAIESGILDQNHKIIKQGEPTIIDCQYVVPFISSYAEAKCILDNGNAIELISSVIPGSLPKPAWYVGKKPSEIRQYDQEVTGIC